jgi:hypothetical protein
MKGNVVGGANNVVPNCALKRAYFINCKRMQSSDLTQIVTQHSRSQGYKEAHALGTVTYECDFAICPELVSGLQIMRGSMANRLTQLSAQ